MSAHCEGLTKNFEEKKKAYIYVVYVMYLACSNLLTNWINLNR